MKEIGYVILVAAIAILIAIVKNGAEIYAEQEYQKFLERVERGEGLKWE